MAICDRACDLPKRWQSAFGLRASDFFRASDFGLRILSVSICVKVDKTRINKGFLDAVDGHCQRKCQYGGGFNHYPPLLRQNSLKLAHYTLRCRDGSVA